MKKILLTLFTLSLTLPVFSGGKKDTSWINNPYEGLDQNNYLAAVGSASNLENAKKIAIQEVTTSILQKVTSETTVNQTATSTGDDFTSYLSNISTESCIKEISNLEIKNTNKASKNSYYARAVLDKTKAARHYSLEITKNSNEIDTLLADAEKDEDLFNACKTISKAYTIAVENDEYGKILSSIRPESRKILSYESSAAVAQALKDKFSQVTVTVYIENDENDTIKNAFSETLNNMGIKTYEDIDADKAYYEITGNVQYESVENNSGNNIFYTRVAISAAVSDRATGKKVFSFNKNKRVGKLSQTESEQSAVREGAKLICSEFSNALKALITE